MTTYYDSQMAGDLVQGGVFTFQPGGGQEIEFWVNIVSNLFSAQATGQTAMFRILSKGHGDTIVSVGYGQAANRKVWGYSVILMGSLANTPDADLRILLTDEKVELTPQVLPGTVAVVGTVDTDFGQSAVPGELEAATALSASAVSNIGGTPMIVASIQDPPQVSVSGGKAVPTKVES